MDEQLGRIALDATIWAVSSWRSLSEASVARLSPPTALALAAMTVVLGLHQARLLSVLAVSASAGLMAAIATEIQLARSDAATPALWAAGVLVGVAAGSITVRSPLALEAATRCLSATLVLGATASVPAFSLYAAAAMTLLALVRPAVGIWTLSCSLLTVALGIRSPLGVWTLWVIGNLVLLELTHGRYLVSPSIRGRIPVADAVRLNRLTRWPRLAAVVRQGWHHAR